MAVVREYMIVPGYVGASGFVMHNAYPIRDTAAEIDLPRPVGHQPDSVHKSPYIDYLKDYCCFIP